MESTQPMLAPLITFYYCLILFIRRNINVLPEANQKNKKAERIK